MTCRTFCDNRICIASLSSQTLRDVVSNEDVRLVNEMPSSSSGNEIRMLFTFLNSGLANPSQLYYDAHRFHFGSSHLQLGHFIKNLTNFEPYSRSAVRFLLLISNLVRDIRITSSRKQNLLQFLVLK